MMSELKEQDSKYTKKIFDELCKDNTLYLRILPSFMCETIYDIIDQDIFSKYYQRSYSEKGNFNVVTIIRDIILMIDDIKTRDEFIAETIQIFDRCIDQGIDVLVYNFECQICYIMDEELGYNICLYWQQNTTIDL
jgi:hypothetical protein